MENLPQKHGSFSSGQGFGRESNPLPFELPPSLTRPFRWPITMDGARALMRRRNVADFIVC